MNKSILDRFKEYVNVSKFNAVKLGLASSKKIESLSYGEVKKIETINYRTLKPERDGLFCARIFGPVKDWECNCGKYKRMKHRGVTCEKCGVEVIQSRVRRERMGHIALVSPVCHIWYLKGIPSYLSIVLNMSTKDLERVIYFDAYVVVHQGGSPYPQKTLLTSQEYEAYAEGHLDDLEFSADMGAEAISSILSAMNLRDEIVALEQAYQKTSSVAIRHKIMRRISILTSLEKSNLKAEWMILKVLPVLPPDLRPLVPLEGGRFASSDLNELYRRVLNRNIRLQRLIEIDAPSVIIKNEKRMLQESVDALIDNGRRGQPVRGSNRRPLKSLSEMLRGKQGRFRQNLLGRRVDYSGRSVIVVDPKLKMDQCGLPKIMALELFKPYVYAKLLERELAPNLRMVKRMVEELQPEIWDVLEEVVRNRPVLLNRAPTLHRLGIQAFRPILVEGKAIKIHPLVCEAFNADFDGDQMAVHIPLSKNAQEESFELILSTKNILSPANGNPVGVPSQDMALGLYYISKMRLGEAGEGTIFSDIAEAVTAFQCESMQLHAKIFVRLEAGNIVETNVGRVLIFETLPKGSDFEWVNKVIRRSDLVSIIGKVYARFGSKATVECLDSIKQLGFEYATTSGISLSMDDLLVPNKKNEIIDKADTLVNNVEKLYMDGVITNGERKNKVIGIWSRTAADVASQMVVDLEQQDNKAFLNEDRSFSQFNPMFMMFDSGARGSRDQIKQLVGMRGLMAKPSGEIIETPVKTNFKHGLGIFEYFISTHGARKGQADTALKTANSGYLTRRLVDAAQDLVVTREDCGTLGYVAVGPLVAAGDIIIPLAKRVFGRVVASDVKDPISGKLLFKQGHLINREDLVQLNDSAVTTIHVRSGLTCQAKYGICALCYGYDLSRAALVDIGTAVGIIAAQSIGEPGTQLTMRTFHVGGTVSGMIEQPFYLSRYDGKAKWKDIKVVKNREDHYVITSRKAKILIVAEDGRELQSFDLEYGSTVLVSDGDKVSVGLRLVEWDAHNQVLLTEKAGIVSCVDLIDNITIQERVHKETGRSSSIVIDHRGDKYQPAIVVATDQDQELHYYLPAGAHVIVKDKQRVEAGDILVRMPRELSKTQDITVGALPRIAELFEARIPGNQAIIVDIDGEVVFGGLYRGLRKVSVVSGAQSFDYYIPRGKQLNVLEGERVNAGDLLTVGAPALQDILRILGPDAVQRYLGDKIQQIYKLQGVEINDRHIELIVRQMMRKVRIIDSGDTDFLVGDKVDKVHFQEINKLLRAERKKPAVAKPILLGITQASLMTESWISSASFQETTRILSGAAIAGDIDYLRGLKENVIVGRLIPAGTGIESFKNKYLKSDASEIDWNDENREIHSHNKVHSSSENGIGA